MTGGDASGKRLLDQAAGPLIRPYALVRGRTMPVGERFDLVSMVTVNRQAAPDPSTLEPEHLRVLTLCRIPRSVADLGTELTLPLGVICVILGDLREQGLVKIHKPVTLAQLPDTQILRRIVDGLRRL
jgi:Protein of unknown function (DUF742)